MQNHSGGDGAELANNKDCVLNAPNTFYDCTRGRRSSKRYTRNVTTVHHLILITHYISHSITLLVDTGAYLTTQKILIQPLFFQMDTTTPDLSYNVSFETIGRFDYINRTAFIASWATFIALALVLNVIVIASIVSLYVKRPTARCGFPKFVLILTVCSAHVALAAGPSAFVVHMHRVQGSEAEVVLSCDGSLALELSFFMLSTFTRLLVAAVVLSEAMQMQKLATLTSAVQMAVAVALLLLSVLYVFVVIISAFYTTWLEDNSEPCSGDTGALNIQSDHDQVRIINVFDYILPHVLIFVSCILLLLAYLTRRAASRPAATILCTVPPASTSPSGWLGSSAEKGVPPGDSRVQGSDNVPVLAAGDHLAGVEAGGGAVISGRSPGTSLGSAQLHSRQDWALAPTSSGSVQTGARPFPFYVLLAAAVPFVFGFVYFFRSFVDTYSELDLTSAQNYKLWAAGITLSALDGVFLPCCWLLDPDVRASWCCRGNGARAAPEGAVIFQDDEGGEGTGESGTTTRL